MTVDVSAMPDAGKSIAKLNAALKSGPNFGGGAIFVENGRGDALHHGVVIDAASGRAQWAPESQLGYEFRGDSRLLVVNPPAAVDAAVASNGCSSSPARLAAQEVRYFDWKDGAFREITSRDACETQLAQEELAEFEARFPNFDATGGVPSSVYARSLADSAARWKMGDCRCTKDAVEAGGQWRCSVCCDAACCETCATETALTMQVSKGDGAVTWTGTPPPRNTSWPAGQPLTAKLVLTWQHRSLESRARALEGR